MIKPASVGAIHELPLPKTYHNNDVPSHIHRRKMLLPKIIGRFKMVSSKQINKLRNMPAFPVWQRNYYEHIVRDEDELNQIREYIRINPQNWDIDIENSDFSEMYM